MTINKETLHFITQEIFYALTAALVLFFIMEIAWERIVLAYINVNIVLIIWVVNATVMLVVSNKQ